MIPLRIIAHQRWTTGGDLRRVPQISPWAFLLHWTPTNSSGSRAGFPISRLSTCELCKFFAQKTNAGHVSCIPAVCPGTRTPPPSKNPLLGSTGRRPPRPGSREGGLSLKGTPLPAQTHRKPRAAGRPEPPVGQQPSAAAANARSPSPGEKAHASAAAAPRPPPFRQQLAKRHRVFRGRARGELPNTPSWHGLGRRRTRYLCASSNPLPHRETRRPRAKNEVARTAIGPPLLRVDSNSVSQPKKGGSGLHATPQISIFFLGRARRWENRGLSRFWTTALPDEGRMDACVYRHSSGSGDNTW